MSGYLIAAAGYLDLPVVHKMALIRICDSADTESRLGFPGLDSIRLWTGLGRSRAMTIIADLQERGLLMQVQEAHRGHRAVYKVFPDQGDEKHSVPYAKGESCPGSDKFSGVPAIPTAAQVSANFAGEKAVRSASEVKRRKTKEAVSIDAKDPLASALGPAQSGPNADSIGSNMVDPITSIGSNPEAENTLLGPAQSGPLQRTNFKEQTSKTFAAANATADEDALFDVESSKKPAKTRTAKEPKKGLDPVTTRAQAICRSWWDSLHIKPIGRNTFIAVQGMVIGAIQAGRSDESIAAALRGCGVGVTQNALNYQFAQQDRPRAGGRQQTTASQGFNDALALARKYAEHESRQNFQAIGG